MIKYLVNGISIYNLKWYSVFIFVFFIIFVSSYPTYSQPIQINLNNIPQKLNYHKIGNCYFISLKDLSDILIKDPEKIIEDNSIILKNEVIKFSPNSFYVLYKNDSIMKVAQMAQTVIENKNEILIPILSFFYALKGIDLINSKIENKIINIISKNIFSKTIIPKLEDTYLSKKKNDLLIINDSSNNALPEIQKNEKALKINTKNSENKSIKTNISNQNNYNYLKDTIKKIIPGADNFIYDSKKDEINPKSYTIPKDLKKPK